MRVKEKPYPLNHGVEVASVVSPNKRQIQPKVTTGIEVEPHNQVLDLSKPSEKVNGFTGTTETDAIHRRLGSLDGDVQNLAKSVVDLMENSSAGEKRKRSPAKVSPLKNVKEPTFAEPCQPVGQPSDVDESFVKKELFKDVSPIDQEVKKETQTQMVVNIEPKGKKKNATQQGKKSLKKRKNVKKKSFAKDDDDFQIDPRLGGTKIKQSISNKGKDKKLKSTDQELKKNKTVEQRCPYIHIEGSWNVPNVVKIVNGHVKEDENDGKASTKLTKAAQYIDEEHRNKVAKVGFTSTLSDRYDTHNRDATWVCVFCQLFTHTQCLGDLYGPYYISQVPAEPIWFSKRNPDSLSHCDSGTVAEPDSSVRTNSKKTKKSPKKKSLVKDEITVQTMPSGDESSARVTSEIPVGIFPLDPTDEKVEVWFHESCLIWAPGVCLVPPRLVGLDEAVSDSQQVICEYCKKRGGHIFCRSRGCGLRTHFPCAVTHGWLLQEETFMALCPTHLDQVAVT